MPIIPDSVTGNNREEWLLADYLVTSVINKASGVHDEECHYNYPRDVYFIGNLSPMAEGYDSLSRADLMQKLSPSAFGAEFKLRPTTDRVEIQIELNWSCYYRVFPTYQQQRSWMRLPNNNADDNDTNINAGGDGESNETAPPQPNDRQQDRRRREDLFLRFKKKNCSAVGKVLLTKNASNQWTVDKTDLTSNINRSIQDTITFINQDNDRIRLRTANQFFTIPSESIESSEAYQQFLATLRLNPTPTWSWNVADEVYRLENNSEEIVLLLQFVNSTQQSENDKAFETYIFNSKAKFTIDPHIIKPFELELAPKSFRYDRNLWGRGFNCGLERNGAEFTTTHTPIYSQNRYRTKNEPEANFQQLAIEPVSVLTTILDSMTAYLAEWETQEEIFRQEYSALWNNSFQDEYRSDKAKFEQEIERFKQGLLLINEDDSIRLAFKLTNETFRRAGLDKDGSVKKDRWRLFQIVFTVSQIPGIAGLTEAHREQFSADREFVDIIYFPTGGGKTEAYLATLVFHCFYDRLRGKPAGVTSWIRFPLRLLTLQQTQRLADTIGIAELVRLSQSDRRLVGTTIDPFSVGYYVGGGEGSTPNEIKSPQNGRPDPTWSMALDRQERQKWKRVVTCPSCKTNTISIEFDSTRVAILHRCTNQDCGFNDGIVPVYVIDNEIYRYLPTVMVGTIDKLAGIGNQRKLSMVFGKVDGKCRVHGYYNSICCQKDCTDKSRLVPFNITGLTGPSLFIQDELHLLKEGLGTFDSHYETFVQYLLRQNNGQSLKIIASSATIEQYGRQVEHLYGKAQQLARVFPGLGPTLQKSFYAQTESYPQRIYVGIIPHNKTIFNSILEIIEFFHRIVQDLAKLNHHPFAVNPEDHSSEWSRLINLYYTSLTYFLSSRDLDQTKTDIESHINNSKFSNEGLNPIETKELTGSTSTDEVTKILERLEKYHEPNEPHEAVLATNMISHGVDIDRLNCMIFYGMPRQNAEYIQSSSRVGRSHIGIVFNCFHPIRERDQSHYSYFNKYHEFLGQLVEPVAINRWSAYGIDKTLPGLFMGTLLQILSNRETAGNRNSYYMLNKISQMYQSGEINKSEIKTLLKDAFKANIAADHRNAEVERKIDRSVDYYFDNIANAGSSESFVSGVLHPKPMRSLRDIDEPIEIFLERLGEQWLNTN